MTNDLITMRERLAGWAEEHESQIRSMKLTFYTLSRSPLSVIGFVIVALFLIVALIGPLIITHPEDVKGSVHMDLKLRAPGSAFPFGTDDMGMDIYSRVIIGTRLSLQIGLIIVFVAMGIGIPLGIIAGYMGGWVSEVIMRITDIFLSIPGLLLALAIVGVLGPGIKNAMIALSLVWWPGYVRLVQGKTPLTQGRVVCGSCEIDRSVEASHRLQSYPSQLHFSHPRQGLHGYGHGHPLRGKPWFHRCRGAASGA